MHIYSQILKKRIEHKLIKGVRENIQKINNSRELSSAQKKEIKHYWKKLLGINVPLDWHRYFFKRTGLFSVKYIPSSLYYSEMIGRFNQFQMNEAYTDKCITDLIMPDIPFPDVIIKNMNGYYFAGNKPISKKEAINLCLNIKDVIIKPSLSCHGNDVKKFVVENGVTSLGMTIGELFDEYGANFLIQKVIHQHKQMSLLNPSSVNTIRILSYHSDNDVIILYSVIRIGRKGAFVDNESSGGISTSIDSEGRLGKFAYGLPGNDMVERTDTGIILNGYEVPSYKDAIEQVKKAHQLLPYFKLVGWDVAIEESGKPIFIEFNTWPELSQSANGAPFGDYTEQILSEIWTRRNSRFFNAKKQNAR